MQVKREHLNRAATATLERTAAELRRGDSASSARLCRQLNGAIDRKIEELRNDGAAVACAPGCAFCCHLRVEVFPHEAAALLEFLTERATPEEAARIAQRIEANAARVDGLTAAQHRTAGIPCAFLSAGRCSAHDVRPSACAAYHSLSRERCEQVFRHPESIGAPRSSRPALLELQAFGAAQIEATKAGYSSAACAVEQVELHQALRMALESRGGLARAASGAAEIGV